VRLPLEGANPSQAFYLRSLADSKAIVAKATSAKRAVVVGASFIGLEVAASLRAKGITVHVGAPEQGIHAIQLEMCQSTYMHETAPFDYAPDAANAVQAVVREMVGGALDVVRSL